MRGVLRFKPLAARIVSDEDVRTNINRKTRKIHKKPTKKSPSHTCTQLLLSRRAEREKERVSDEHAHKRAPYDVVTNGYRLQI